MQRYLFIFFFLPAVLVSAQKPIYLHVEVLGKDSAFIRKNISYEVFNADSAALSRQLNGILIRCGELSFLQAEYVSFNMVNDTLTAGLQPGVSYKWVRLRKGNVPDDIISAAGFREEQFVNKTFNPVQYTRRAERMLQTLENAGYPFASIRLDSIEADSAGISAAWNLERNELILFDSIDIIGNANIKKWFLNKYLGLKAGAPYNEILIKNMDSRLSQLPFLRTTRNSYVYFYGQKAKPVLFLDNRKASSVDGIIGFAPGTENNNNKLLITGEANLKLQNLFATGKSLDVNYRSFLGNSQELKLKFVYPYIFRSNLAFDYELNFLKQDTTFLDVRNELGLQYRFIGTDYFRFFYNLQTTSLITIDTVRIKATRQLPEAADIRNDQYGLGFRITRYDYFFNPRKGFSAEATASIGTKKIIRNPTIDEIKFSGRDGIMVSVYDTMKLVQLQYRFTGNADVFIPLGGRSAIRLQGMGGHIVSQNLFFNELFRIGGIRTLKGFDEQSIYASSYMIINTELRYLLQQNSNVILFWNGAYYQNAARHPALSDKPYGFGAGMNFETGPGVFSIFYAVGKAFENPLEFDKAKIHFGFVNFF